MMINNQSFKEATAKIINHHAETVSLSGDMKMDDEDAVEAILAAHNAELLSLLEGLRDEADKNGFDMWDWGGLINQTIAKIKTRDKK